ncbi:IS4/IS5 family transposase, partial [Rhizobium ruizarguesonis]
MKIRPEILDHWPEVRERLPADFDLEATARLRGAFTRVREIKNAETLLRLALAYGGLGMSLRETCAWAESPVCQTHRCSSGCAKRRLGLATSWP